jgi:hypothetical protein
MQIFVLEKKNPKIANFLNGNKATNSFLVGFLEE